MPHRLAFIALLIVALLSIGCGQDPPPKKAKRQGQGLSKMLQPPSDYSNIDESDPDDGEGDAGDMDAAVALPLSPRTPPTVAECDAFDLHARRWLMQAPDEQLLLVRALERFSRQSIKESDPAAGEWREGFNAWKQQAEKLLVNREMEDWVVIVRSYGFSRDAEDQHTPDGSNKAKPKETIKLDASLGASLDDIQGAERFARRQPFIKIAGEGANDELAVFVQPNYQRSYLRVWGTIRKARISDGVPMNRGGLHFPIELEIDLKQVRHMKGDETGTRIAW